MASDLLVLPVLLWSLFAARSLRRDPRFLRLPQAAAGLIGLTVLLWLPGALLGLMTLFGLMRMASLAIFVGGPVLCLGLLLGLRGSARLLPGLLALALVAVGVDAFLVEPRRLQTQTLRIGSEELVAPVRVVLIADIQTDHVGAHEARALREAAAARPDLVLFTGDYVQLHDGPDFREQADALSRAIVDSGLEARLGMFAVRGDVDPDTWARVFEGTGVRVLTQSATLLLDGLTLTALSPEDSRSNRPPVPQVQGPHLVMGHSPDFALARPPADLLLAGHTHGGQVRLPGFGPLLTFAEVPRAWAAGHTELPWGGDLVVSRGIGMERRDAPRLRFFCPPELVIVDLVPAPGLSDVAASTVHPAGPEAGR